MARRSLLTGEERRRLFEPPTSDREIATRYTLSLEELDWIEERRRPANKLGAAVQLALVRHPGFGWTGSQTVAPALLKFIADGSTSASRATISGAMQPRQPQPASDPFMIRMIACSGWPEPRSRIVLLSVLWRTNLEVSPDTRPPRPPGRSRVRRSRQGSAGRDRPCACRSE